MFDGKDNNIDDREKKSEEEQKDNMNVFIADSYSHTVAIIRICLWEQDVIKSLKSFVLSHTYHSLRMVDDT